MKDSMFTKMKKEPRIILSFLLLIALFIPWSSISASASVMGYSAEAEGESYSGFTAILAGSYLLLLAIIVPVVFLLMETIFNFNKSKKVIYLIGSLITMVIVAVFTGLGIGIKSSGEGFSVESHVTCKIGFWITLLAYAVIIIITVIKDFRVNKENIKDKGIKGVASGIVSEVESSKSDIKYELKDAKKKIDKVIK